jgi:hypothetical protein
VPEHRRIIAAGRPRGSPGWRQTALRLFWEQAVMRNVVVLSIAVLGLALPGGWAAEVGGFVPLFNGRDLSGWTGDPALWRVEEGAIVGSTETTMISHNSFLASEKKCANFVLRLQFKLRNHNSGVQVRSQQFPDHVVRGYQPDIAESRYTGILYEEGGRGILADVDPAEVAKHFKRDDWNQYEITCDGPRIAIVLNGYQTVSYTESSATAPKEGIIAFQLHAGPAMQVRFKDIEIKALP